MTEALENRETLPKVLLKTKELTIRFGGLVAVKDLNLEIRQGELFGLIGPNGAGKTTIFNLITGVYAPTGGSIHLENTSIHGLKPHVIAKAGIARTFQNIRLFSTMTVLENILVARHLRRKQNVFTALFRSPSFLKEEQCFKDEAMELLRLFQLEHLADEAATSLPYGSQRRLEMARALATQPKLLLLDEPAAGMNPQEAAELMALIHRLRDEFHLTILLVEHNMKVVMGVCEKIQVIDHGESIALGSPGEIRNDAKVIEAYLGKE